jgi:hypothetical protein
MRNPAAEWIKINSEVLDPELFEVRGMRRPRRGMMSEDVAASNKVAMHFDGLDGRTQERHFCSINRRRN